MKFYSKYSNYQITLRPSLPGNILMGIEPKPGLSILFQNGMINVDDPETIRLMKLHSAFTRGDFFADPDEAGDPYKDTRKSNEPEHNISQVKHGEIKNLSGKPKVIFSSEQKKEIKKMMADVMSEGIKIGKKSKESESGEVKEVEPVKEEEKVKK